MKVGYIRVSTEEQNLARQEEIMSLFGVEKLFCDKLSGKNTNRDEFRKMMGFVREGDTLYVESFSRLSRSTRDLLNTVDRLRGMGVNLVSHKEKLDMSTPQGKFMLTVFAALSELERESMLERQREGIAIAKAEGKYRGRRPKDAGDRFFVAARAWSGGTMRLRDAVAASGMSEATFFRNCKKFGISKGARRADGTGNTKVDALVVD